MLDSKIREFLKIFRYGKKLFRCAYKSNRLTYSNFIVKTLEEGKRFRSVVFVVDFEHVERTVFSMSMIAFSFISLNRFCSDANTVTVRGVFRIHSKI